MDGAPAAPPGMMSAGPMDVEQAPASPPNLRDAADEMTNCGSCQHFQENPGGGGACAEFGGYPCEAVQVCDAHAPAEAAAGGEQMGDMASLPFGMEA